MVGSQIGAKVKARRRELGLTQAGLAKAIGASPTYVNLIENGKRSIGGSLLRRVAEALETTPRALDDADDRRLAAALEEIATETVVRDARPDAGGAAALVGRHPDWARAMLLLHRAYVERDRTALALSDRLNQDPFLQDGMHQMIGRVSAIRSAAEILREVDDLTASDRSRFHGMIGQESARLSELALSFAAFFSKSDTDRSSLTPAEEVDDFIAAHGNYFPEIEDAADRMRLDSEKSGRVSEQAILSLLERRHRLEIIAAAPEEGAALALTNRGTRLDEEGGRAYIASAAPPARRRFELARIAAQLSLRDVAEEIVSKDPRLKSEEARRRAAEALLSYAAAAALSPYDAFLEKAESLRYDIEALANQFSSSFEQTAHRLTSLRRPGAEGVPFGFMRVDPSGFVTKRFALPGLPLPRIGGACPLWALYEAFQTPDRLKTQLVEFPNGDRFFFIARTQQKANGATRVARHAICVQLACDALHADRLIYAAGAPEPVGATCRLCARRNCSARQEEPPVAEPASPEK